MKQRPKFSMKKLEELEKRMHRHGELGDVAVVVLTAFELNQLLDLARIALEADVEPPS